MLLLMVFPGLVVLAKIFWPHAAFVGIVVASLIATASAHTLIAGRTTPDRLILAVVPLLIWPVAVLVRRCWGSSLMRTATVALGVVSLNAALAYNWHHIKAFGPLRDLNRSGWAPNLAFPTIRGLEGNSSPNDFLLLLCWVAFAFGLSWVALRANRPVRWATASSGRFVLACAVAASVAIGGLTVASAATGSKTSATYQLHDAAARAEAARALVGLESCLCFTSLRSHVDWTTQPNSARGAAIGVQQDELRVTVQVIVEGDGRTPAFGRVRMDFGDGEETAWNGIVSERLLTHTYSRPGTYPLKVWFRLPGEIAPRLYATNVEVTD
jgi:hypothetical protein